VRIDVSQLGMEVASRRDENLHLRGPDSLAHGSVKPTFAEFPAILRPGSPF
jgi:hypothetical protein